MAIPLSFAPTFSERFSQLASRGLNLAYVTFSLMDTVVLIKVGVSQSTLIGVGISRSGRGAPPDLRVGGETT